MKSQPISLQLFKELRSRLLRSILFVIIIFFGFLFFANQLYSFLAKPLLQFLPDGHLIATQIVSPFFVPFKLAFMAATIVSIPFILYQLWSFIAPALYGHEKKLLWPFIFISTLLFYLGIAFTYFIIFPMLFKFLAGTAPQGVSFSPDINEYLDFTIKLLLIFGVLFEIPMVMFFLVSAKIVTYRNLKSLRSYAIVGSFIIGMLFAPPDVLSQTILALPIWLLYEFGLIMCYIKDKNHG